MRNYKAVEKDYRVVVHVPALGRPASRAEKSVNSMSDDLCLLCFENCAINLQLSSCCM